jgi:plasmid maintenance system antidote protein VapI
MVGQDPDNITAELLERVGRERKDYAKELGYSRDWLDKIAAGKRRLSLVDAGRLAKKLQLSLELVERANPASDFRRALRANDDLSPQWRQTILGAFAQAKMEAHSGAPTAVPIKARNRVVRPKKGAAVSSR